MRFGVAHCAIKQRIIIDGWRSDLFVGPAVQHRHRNVFDAASQASFTTEVVAKPAGNLRECLGHKTPICQNENPLSAFALDSGFLVSSCDFALLFASAHHNRQHAVSPPMMVGKMVMGVMALVHCHS